MDFRCPVCACLLYERVTVTRADGKPYPTEFQMCLGCSAVFMEPELFTAAKTFQQSAPATLPGMAHQVSGMRTDLQYRYWQAKLRRESGGMEPTPQQVVDAKLARS